MKFDIEKFLQYNNIPIRYKGENVSKGELGVCCPFCIKSGRGDTNFHMGINPDNGAYSCWRYPKTHAGRKMEKLVRMFLECSYEEAYKIVYDTAPVDLIVTDNLVDIVNKLFDKKSAPKQESDKAPKELLFPSEFIDIKSTGVTKKFYDYITSRGFVDVDKLIKKYSLFCALNGKYANRIIFPFCYQGELVTWSSRTLDQDLNWRYLDLEVEKSVIHVKQLLYNYDSIIEGGNLLVITEGLFDCIKLDYFFSKGNRATCLSTKHMTTNQGHQIRRLSKVFNKIVIFMDSDAMSASWEIRSEFCTLPNVTFKFLPVGFKDPGDFTTEEIKNLENEYETGTH
jgi:hypothetical protein